ncbi:MAG: hypothetical protein JWN44_3304 [Myxococcales bacterium]|nr:hypothetical protein [Myxococcales bacterium]
MSTMIQLAIIVSAAGFLAALPYVFLESRWRWRWREVEAGRVAADAAGGIYRSAGEVPRYLTEAPPLVRVAAYSCFVFGQMFVPGLVIGLFGVMMAGIGLVSIPGLITAAKIYRAGMALLRRDPRIAYFRARDAAAWALWLNGVIMIGSLFVLATPLRPHGSGGLLLVGFTDLYGVASIAQALLLRRAARTYEDALFADSATSCV